MPAGSKAFFLSFLSPNYLLSTMYDYLPTYLPSLVKKLFRPHFSQKAQIVSVEHGPESALQFRAHVSICH